MDRVEFRELFPIVKKVDDVKNAPPLVLLRLGKTITKQEYNAQIKGQPQFALSFRGSLPILYSLGDAIQKPSQNKSDFTRL